MSQDTRCWYYRARLVAATAPAATSATPTRRRPINREHAILDADRCVAVSPSDTAPALIALDAQMVIRAPRRRARGRRRRLLHRPRHRHHADDRAAAGRAADGDPHPGDVGRRALLLREGARPPGVGLPAASTSPRRSRTTAAGSARRASSSAPWRRGRCACTRSKRRWPASRSNEDTATLAGELAIEGAQALRYNAYKVPLMRNLVRRAVRGGPLPATT